MHLLLLLLLLLEGRYLEAAFKLAGPYNVEILSVHYCGNGEPETFNYTLKFTKKSKSEMVWNSPFNVIHDLDDDVWAKATAAKWGFGGWGLNAIVQDLKPACSKWKEYFPGFFKMFTDSVGIPNECPIPKGSYKINELPLNIGKLQKFPSLPYGKYKAKVDFLKGDERFSCGIIVAEITEEVARK